ncbi:uncharacterized protein J3D65DRAFT_662447 [Phyllosticta citribraziliensis]|uniref:Wax synthase domain-containing protein n=1 Tax=Phyllosticta citribraziliensis TaxID=989973 RepID=A0ABR1L6X6_9PEZI
MSIGYALGAPPLDERLAMPGLFIPSFYIVLIFSILIRPAILRKFVITAVILSYLVAYFHYTAGIDADYQNTTMLLSSAIMWVEFGVFQDLEQGQIFRTWETEETQVSDRPWWKKLAWSYDLWTSWRGPGWNWQSSRSPKLPTHVTDRRSFLVDNFKRGIYCWIMSDALLFLLESTPYTRLEERQHIQAAPIHVQAAVVWLAALHTQYSMSFMYRIVASVLVAIGVCSPVQCPPLFGPFRRMYTVGNLWGICWQQMMRRVGFQSFASGSMHAAGAYSATRGSLGDMRFFMSQTLAIIAEDCVMSLGKLAGIRKSGKCQSGPSATRPWTVSPWINYVPQIRTFEKSYNGRAGSLYPAWEVFNASGASASWANPVLPTNEESIVCRRRIRRGHRLLIALWHPDRASPATNGSVGGLRTLLDLSNQQLRVVSQIIQQAYNDAVFGCMTAAQKSTWLNHLTARLPAEWDTLDAFDVTSEDIVDRADPTDMGLDLTTREYVHVTQCMEREGVPWEVALHKLRQQRRTLWFRCKMVVEQVVSVLSGRAGRHQDEFRHPGGPALERTLRRQRALESLMERTGALNGCLDTGEKQTRPWWERKDFDPSMDQQQQRGTTLWISDTTCPSRRLSSTHPINPPPVWSFTIIILIHPSIYGHTAATILSIHPSIHIHTPRQNERQYIQMGGMTTIKTTSKRRPCQALIADGSRLCAYAARPDSDTCTVHIFASGREKKERKTATAAKSQKSSNQGDGRGKFFELAPAVTRMARRQPMRSEPDDDNNNDDERGLRRRCLGGGPAAGGRRADPRHDKGIEGFGEDGAVRPGHSQISQSSPRSDVGYECTFAASIHPSPSSPLVVNPKNPNGRPPNLYVLPQVSSSVVHHHHRTSSRPTASISASASASSSSGALVVSVVRASTAGASPPSKSSVCATAAGASPSSKPSVSTTTILSATPSSSSSSFSSSSSDKSRGGEKSCRLGYHSTDCYLTLGVTMLADTRRRRVPLLVS